MLGYRLLTVRRKREESHPKSLLVTIRLHASIASFSAVFLAGILLGSIAPGFLDANSRQGFNDILQLFLRQRQLQTMAETFFSAISSNAVLWVILLLCGFCAVSAPLIFLVILIKGMGYGLFASALISQYGAGAFVYLACCVLPNLLISGIALLFCCQESSRMSKSIWQMLHASVRGTAQGDSAGEYAAKMILYGVFLCLGAALEAYLCPASLAGLVLF